MQASKLLRPNTIRKIHSFTKSRLGFSRLGISNLYYCSKTTQQDDDEETFKEPNENDFVSVIKSHVHHKKSCNPEKLLHLYNQSATEMGTSQNLKYYLNLSISLCNSNEFKASRRVIDKIVKIGKPIPDVVDAITNVELTSAVMTQLVYAYKIKCTLDEAVDLLLSCKNVYCFPDLVCLSSLMSDLLKNNKLDLFWKVHERSVEAKVTPDVYTYSNLINAYCRSGNMEDAKRVSLEMEEKNCSPTLVTYGLLINGLCRYGLVNEALEYKKSMTEKGLILDEY